MALLNFSAPYAPTGAFLAAAASASAISGFNSISAANSLIYNQQQQAYRSNLPPPAPSRTAPRSEPQQRSPRYYSDDNYKNVNTARPPTAKKEELPSRPSGYTRIDTNEYANQPGAKTSLHAVLDYDDDFDDYSYDDDDVGDVPPGFQNAHYPVTPIQGPIYIKNGSVPVVPLYSYPVLNNGTFVQIPVSTLYTIIH